VPGADGMTAMNYFVQRVNPDGLTAMKSSMSEAAPDAHPQPAVALRPEHVNDNP
jgi:hypothetical protein